MLTCSLKFNPTAQSLKQLLHPQKLKSASLSLPGVSLSHGGGTSYGIASEALSIGDKVFGDAGGKLAAAGGAGDLVGITLTAATADGDVVEVATIY